MNWKTYFIVEASGSTTPTAAQIKAGTNASNTAALRAGTLTMLILL
jgi:hypothetical protein